jgi:hypothetical protein
MRIQHKANVNEQKSDATILDVYELFTLKDLDDATKALRLRECVNSDQSKFKIEQEDYDIFSRALAKRKAKDPDSVFGLIDDYNPDKKYLLEEDQNGEFYLVPLFKDSW